MKHKSPTSSTNTPGGTKTPTSKDKARTKKHTPSSTSTRRESEMSSVRDEVTRNFNLDRNTIHTLKISKKKSPRKEKLTSKKSHRKKLYLSGTSTKKATQQKSPTSTVNAFGGMETPTSKNKGRNNKQTPPSTGTWKKSETSIGRDRVARSLNLDSNKLHSPKLSKKKPLQKKKLPAKNLTRRSHLH